MRKKIICFSMIFLVLFGSFNDNKSHAIEPLTAGAIAFGLSTLALSLGFSFIDSQSDNFVDGVMQLYSNFTTNVKNIVDRIARKKMEGSPTFDITPDELQAFGNDLTSAIEASLTENNGVTVFNFPSHAWDTDNSFELKSYHFDELNFDQYYLNNGYDYGTKVPMRLYYDNKIIWDRYYIRTKIDNPNHLFRYQINNAVDDTHYSSGYTSLSSNIPYVRAWKNYGNSYFDLFIYNWNERFYFDKGYTLDKFRIELGQADENMPVIGVGDMPIDELILALKNSGVLNGQGAITQNFISNFDTALPSDAYNDLNNKAIVDGLFTGFDTALPDAPADLGILQNIYSVLNNTYLNVRTGLANLYAKVSSIALAISSVFAYDPTLKLDYSGFSNLIIKDRFPFSIPFDLYNSVKMFSASASQPYFNISINNKFLNINHTIDISFMHLFILFFRWVCNIWFSMFLILKTRDMIKW